MNLPIRRIGITAALLVCLPGLAANDLSGTWSLKRKGVQEAAELTFEGSGRAYRGQMKLKGKTESLANLTFDPLSGRLQFTLPSTRESYSGTLSGSTLKGQVERRAITLDGKASARSDSWEAQRMALAAAPRSAEAIVGTWVLGRQGSRDDSRLEFKLIDRNITGRIRLGGRWEKLEDVRFNAESAVLTFQFQGGKESYRGTLAGDTLSGLYEGDIVGLDGKLKRRSFTWKATRMK